MVVSISMQARKMLGARADGRLASTWQLDVDLVTNAQQIGCEH